MQAFIAQHLTDELRQRAARTTTVFADKDLAMQWQRILVAKGWAVPHWLVEWGGTGWSITQKHIFGAECARAGTPGLIPLGLRMLAPVLLKYGTDEQRRHYLPRMLSGEHYWCQGYSEPSSGSDLSSLRTRRSERGRRYVERHEDLDYACSLCRPYLLPSARLTITSSRKLASRFC